LLSPSIRSHKLYVSKARSGQNFPKTYRLNNGLFAAFSDAKSLVQCYILGALSALFEKTSPNVMQELSFSKPQSTVFYGSICLMSEP
jgi:hypothetical protein